jgi:hypothetical protein
MWVFWCISKFLTQIYINHTYLAICYISPKLMDSLVHHLDPNGAASQPLVQPTGRPAIAPMHPANGSKKSDPFLVEIGSSHCTHGGYIPWPPHFWIWSILFVFFFGYLALAFETDDDDNGKILGAQSDGAMSGGSFVVISTAVISDCGAFGLRLLRLGFGSPTSTAVSMFAVR